MSTQPVSPQAVSEQAKAAAGQTAGTAKDEAAQTAQTAKDAAADTAQTAQHEAAHVASTAQSAVADVAGTAKEQVTHVAGEALDQVKDLTDQVRTQLSEQAGKAAGQLAQAVRSLADELHQMSAHGGDNHGAASQAAGSLSERGHRFADYLEGRDPQAVVGDLRGSAARRPGAFLLGSMLAGVLTGRLVKGGRAASETSAGGTPPPAYTPATAGYVPVPVTPVPVRSTPPPSFTMPVAAPGAEPVVQRAGTPYPDTSSTPLGDAAYESTFGSTPDATPVTGPAGERSQSDEPTTWLS